MKIQKFFSTAALKKLIKEELFYREFFGGLRRKEINSKKDVKNENNT